MDSFLLLTRPGFESDCAAEAAQRCANAGLAGFAKAKSGQGFLEWSLTLGQPQEMPTNWIFARQVLPIQAAFNALPADDRVSALLALLPEGACWQGVTLCHADTNEGRSLSRFLSSFQRPLETALKAKGRLYAESKHQLVLFFIDSCNGFICQGAPDPHSLPRLRLRKEAPSRSALKIEEGLLHFLDATQRAGLLRAGQTAVDLGAAPGGWSWYLASRGLRVTGVDHGRLQQALMDNYPVQQVFADAYTWRPPKPVDWLVCDVVEKPARTQALMLKWLQRGWAKQALFNLKLPMKQRFKSLWPLLESLHEEMNAAGQSYHVQAHHLYHDREEVTVLVRPIW